MAKQNLDELIEASEETIEKGGDLSEFETEHHHKEKPKAQSSKSKIEEEIKEKKFEKEDGGKGRDGEKGEKGKEDIDDIEGIKDIEGDKDKKEKREKPKSKAKAKVKIRSKKYQEARALIDVKKKYEILEGIELTKKTSMTKFDGNIEVHIRLIGKNGKPEQNRGLIKYPHSTGKKIQVIILDEKIIGEILESKSASGDIYLATPKLMPQVGKLAKILGPKGKMPNPKSGTVTDDPEKTKNEMEAGQVEYKTDSYGIIHQVIGKVSNKSNELEENYKSLISVLPVDKIATINLCATMGPGIKISR